LAMEIMRQNGVRLIGVDDGLDTDVEDDFIPFRNVLHEFYACVKQETTKKALFSAAPSRLAEFVHGKIFRGCEV
jgi:hypothetical protein